jgi:hypothetical protein
VHSRISPKAALEAPLREMGVHSPATDSLQDGAAAGDREPQE